MLTQNTGTIPKEGGTGPRSSKLHETKSQKTAGLNGEIEHVLKHVRDIDGEGVDRVAVGNLIGVPR